MYNRKQRILYLDVLNIFACFAVLMLHHNGIVHNYNVNSLAWKQALIFEVLFYWAVPIFFMLTGATLVSYREQYSTKVFFTKRFFEDSYSISYMEHNSSYLLLVGR